MRSFYSARSVSICCYDKEDLERFINDYGFANDCCEYAYVFHDRDVNYDGSLKVSHYHLYAKRRSPITADTLASFRSTCKQNFFYENVLKEQSLLSYLTHSGSDKFQYPVSAIISNFDVQAKIDSTQPVKSDINIVEVLDLLDNGYSIRSIIRKFPKLLYSISSLRSYREISSVESSGVKKPDFADSIVDSEIIQLDYNAVGKS